MSFSNQVEIFMELLWLDDNGREQERSITFWADSDIEPVELDILCDEKAVAYSSAMGLCSEENCVIWERL